MIKEADIKDFPELATKLTQELYRGWWGSLPYELTPNDLLAYLIHIKTQYGFIIYVSEDEEHKDINGCIIGSLRDTDLPPHLKIVTEIIWLGQDSKIKTELWREVEKWGKERGAVLSAYSSFADKPEQTLKWRSLYGGI